MRSSFIAALSLLALLTLASLLAACDVVGLSCTQEAEPSVEITVIDEMEVVQGNAKVRYSIEGRAEEDAECAAPKAGGEAGAEGCGRWVAAFEQTGSFLIKAESADGTKRAEASVVVGAGECHVETVELTLMLR